MRASSSCICLCAAACLTQMAWAQSPPVTCQNAKFSAAVMERFPRVREACLEVLNRDSQYYAVFKAKLVRVSQSNVRIEPKLPDGSYAEARQVKVSPRRRVLVDGHAVGFDELALGQELTVYIEVSAPMVVFPPAEKTDPWQPEPLEEVPPPNPPKMPSAALPVPWTGVGALLGRGAFLWSSCDV
jgi:hypothetical protein